MKTTMMSLCAVAVLAGSAYAQQANPVPPAENPPVAAPENPTPVPPAPPIEEVKKEKPPVNTDVSEAYKDVVARLMGESRPMRFVTDEKKGLLKRLFGG